MDMMELLFEIILVWAVLCAIQIPLRRSSCKLLRVILFLVKVILIPVPAILFVSVDWRFAYRHGDILCAFYVAIVGDTAAGVIEYIIRRLRKNRENICNQKLAALLGFVCCAVFTVYGYINSQQIVRNTHEWQANGLAREHTFAFVADIHAGSAQPVECLQSLCDQINEAEPEFVILGGDVTDELTSYDDMKATYEILAGINAPKYFIYGNHDRQPGADYVDGRTYSDEQLSEAILGAGIIILQDEYVRLADDLFLLGRDDYTTADTRKGWAELCGFDTGGAALVVADHQPYDNEQLGAEESALQLSGHTHAGQLWPLQIIYRILGYQAYGEFVYPGTLLYVSAGESDWMIPLRTEEHCEWDLIMLHP